VSGNEIYESFRPAEAPQETKSNNLAEYILEPTKSAQFMQKTLDDNHSLVAQRILPDLDLSAMTSQSTTGIHGERPDGKIAPANPDENAWIRGERPEGKIVAAVPAGDDWIGGERPAGKIVPDFPAFLPPERPIAGLPPSIGGQPEVPGGDFPLPRGAFPGEDPGFEPLLLALDESGKRIEEIQRPDGTYFGSPTKEIHYDNGATRWEFDDGSTVEIRKNGLAIGEESDHDVTVKLPDGSWLYRSPGDPAANVKDVAVDDDGTVWYHYKDGALEAIAPDNTRTYMNEYGRVTTYPDGTQQFENTDGTWAWHDPSTGEWKGGDKNGTVRWEIDEHGKRTDYDEHGKKVHTKRKHR